MPKSDHKMVKVDAIIPLYNKAETIKRAVQSVINQTFTQWRLTVVDDGSTDHSADLVGRFTDKRIRLIRQENSGPGAARNRGIHEASSRYVAFLDADDEWLPEYLANMYAALEEHDAALVGGMYYEWPKQDDMTGYWRRRGVVPGVYELAGDEDPAWVESLALFYHVGNSVVRTETARAYGGFFEERCVSGEDSILFMRIVPNERVMVIRPAGTVHHREDSHLSNTHEHAVAPFLERPEIILDYVPEGKRDLIKGMIARFALRTARMRARHGQQEMAKQLLRQHPEARGFGLEYYRCRYELMMSPVMPYWVGFKCAIGPRVRRAINQMRHRQKET